MNMMTRPTSPPTILVTNPALVSLMAEGQIVDATVKQVSLAVSTLDCANNDLAIAMWIRVRGVLANATRDRAKAYREIERAKREGRAIDELDFDAFIQRTDTTDWVLHSIGRYRAYASITAAYETAQAVERSPTKLMRFIDRSLAATYDTLFAELGRLIEAEVQLHCQAGGAPFPRENRTVKCGGLGEGSIITVKK